MKKTRSTNIELLRIVMILIVIAHHYVVNSGILKLYDLRLLSGNRIFIQIFGCGGKIAINCFLIISGYFMCQSTATLLKWLKLFLELMFYNVVLNVLFLIIGYNPLGTGALYRGFFTFFQNLGTGRDVYTSLFLILFLLSPFLNKLIATMKGREYAILLGILLFVYTIISTFYIRKIDTGWIAVDNWEGIGWYVTVYLIGGFIRLHLPQKLDSLLTGVISSLISATLVATSIVLIDIIGAKRNFISAYHFVYGSNKLLAIVTAISIFILFKNINIKNNKVINLFASTTFGVLLIHGNSDTMRNFLWNDLFRNASYYEENKGIAIWHPILCVLTVYVICAGIDLCRQFFLEVPLFKRLEKVKFLTVPLYKWEKTKKEI